MLKRILTYLGLFFFLIGGWHLIEGGLFYDVSSDVPLMMYSRRDDNGILASKHRPYNPKVVELSCRSALPKEKADLVREIHHAVSSASQKYGVEKELLYAVIFSESGCNPKARSPRGAVGLMQLMPSTAEELGYADYRTVRGNIFAGAKYLSRLRSQFPGTMQLAVAAYNAGPNAVQQYRGIPPYRETRNYTKKVLRYYESLKGNAGGNRTAI